MRMRRRYSERSQLPTAPGWYNDGAGSLRYYSKLGWTERTRPLPTYTNLPGFDHLPPYRLKTKRKARTRLKKGFSLVIVVLLVISVLAQIETMTNVSRTSPKLVPLITSPSFTKISSRTCSALLPKPPFLALTGARYVPSTGTYEFLSSPFQGVKNKVLQDAINHNQQLLAAIDKIVSKFKAQEQQIPGVQNAVSDWILAWSTAANALGAYNNALKTRSSQARIFFKSAAADLEWINVFSKANGLSSCANFSTELV